MTVSKTVIETHDACLINYSFDSPDNLHNLLQKYVLKINNSQSRAIKEPNYLRTSPY